MAPSALACLALHTTLEATGCVLTMGFDPLATWFSPFYVLWYCGSRPCALQSWAVCTCCSLPRWHPLPLHAQHCTLPWKPLAVFSLWALILSLRGSLRSMCFGTVALVHVLSNRGQRVCASHFHDGALCPCTSSTAHYLGSHWLCSHYGL